jgi:putative ABC transport system ATP-binding protein
VARAIVHRPRVILADEPTGALDAASARIVIELLVEVQVEIGATLVLVTHDPAIADHLDRVVHLAGRDSPKEPPHAG